MAFTTDPNDPRLGHGVDAEPTEQHDVYLVLSEEERAKGFVRPVRYSYRHVGASGPQYPLLELTDEQRERFGEQYAKYEAYPESESPKVGKYWTQAELDRIGAGCGTVTVMVRALADTWARDPNFYGATYCVGCARHLPVEEFIWVDGRSGNGERLGT